MSILLGAPYGLRASLKAQRGFVGITDFLRDLNTDLHCTLKWLMAESYLSVPFPRTRLADIEDRKLTKFIKTGIADKNDYPLYFEKVVYEADIDENVEINHNFLNVTAKTHGEGEYI
uniref:Uncharacterized protein n=1 Tax=Anopheles atroparvus TaxID=41427 RepID=A0A182J0C9_ANOAO